VLSKTLLRILNDKIIRMRRKVFKKILIFELIYVLFTLCLQILLKI